MAIEIQRKFSVNIGAIVNSSVEAVRSIRRREQAIKEAEFQKAIASGLSYEEQVKIRQEQLKDERASSLSDSSYIATLEKSISETKRLGRFNKYRTKYVESLTELYSGKVNEQSYLFTLKNQLSSAVDSDLRLEIQKDIAIAEKGLKTYNDTILSNRVKLAKNDKTVEALASIVSRVTVARANALINGKEDDVTAYDETLSALQSQLEGVRIQDAMQDFQLKSATRGTNALERLEFMNSEIQRADGNLSVRIDEGNGKSTTYASVQQFWSTMRDDYLSATFFKEFENDVSNNILISSRIGMSQKILDDIQKTYQELRSRPEIAPFLSQLDAQQASIMNDAVGRYARQIVEVGSQNRDYDNADAQLQNLSIRFGTDLTPYRVDLRNKNITEVNAGKVEPGDIESLPLPIIEETPESSIPSVPTSSGAVPPVVEAESALPTPGVAPVETSTPIPSTLPPNESPTPTPAPVVTPIPPSTYTGSSIVDYLKSVGQDSSTENRAKLAVEKNVVKSEDEYFQAAESGTNATLNTSLLNLLRQAQ